MSTPEKHEVVYKIECSNCNSVPTERYILLQRLITLFDEWGFYILLAWLLVNNYTTLFCITAVIGTAAILNSYARLWRLEKLRFGDAVNSGT